MLYAKTLQPSIWIIWFLYVTKAIQCVYIVSLQRLLLAHDWFWYLLYYKTLFQPKILNGVFSRRHKIVTGGYNFL